MPIPITCPECGHALRLKETLAGKKVRCPECAEVIVVPGSSGSRPAKKAPDAASTQKFRADVEDDDDEDEDDEDDRPRRKKLKKRRNQNSSAAVNMIVGLAVALLMIGGGVAWMIFTAKSENTKLNPAYGIGFIVIGVFSLLAVFGWLPKPGGGED